MPLKSPVLPYDASSPQKFEAERQRIEAELPGLIREIHHIGSTSIPDIEAKPEIDLLIIVYSMSGIDQVNQGMSALGYDVRGDTEGPGNHYFSKDVQGKRTHKAHICVRSHPHARDYIIFRDYLRDHPALAAQYGQLKAHLAKDNKTGIREYIDGKEPFIRNILQMALDEGYGF